MFISESASQQRDRRVVNVGPVSNRSGWERRWGLVAASLMMWQPLLRSFLATYAHSTQTYAPAHIGWKPVPRSLPRPSAAAREKSET